MSKKKISFLFVFLLLSVDLNHFVLNYQATVKENILYSLPTSDRISAVHQLSNGWIITGVGLSDRDTPGSEATFVLSKDNGQTWEEIFVKEATDMKTYMIQSNENVVIAVRGDRGEPQVLRSEDYGLTWKVALSTNDIYKICGSKGPLYSVIYHKYEKVFYVFPKDAVIQSNDNGLTWTKSALIVKGTSRNAYYVDETDDMIIPTFGLLDGAVYIYRKGAKSTKKVLSGGNFTAFAYLGNKIMLVSSFGYIVGKDIKATKAQRTDGKLTVILEKSNAVKAGQKITLSVPPNNEFSNYNNTNTIIQKAVGPSIEIIQDGPDTPLTDLPELSRIYTGLGTNTIFRSEDNGETWKVVHKFEGCNAAGYVQFARNFPVLGNGRAFLSVAGYEEEYNREGVGEILETKDYGLTWSINDEIRGINNHRLNAIYVSTTLKDGRLICGAQYGRIIMTLENA